MNERETAMMDDRISAIREAEAYSHTAAYTNLQLFEDGSWLSKPVKSVMDQVSAFRDYPHFRGLDLGCGIGRNCIPVLQALAPVPAVMDCVDILPLAIEKLRENADKFGISESVNAVVCPVDHYPIAKNTYDMILGISVLEHLDSVDTMKNKLSEIRRGLKKNGIACFVINTSIKEHDAASGKALPVQFEINLTTAEMQELLTSAFSEDEMVKQSVIHYQYDTYRESGTVRLDTDVLTCVVRKRS